MQMQNKEKGNADTEEGEKGEGVCVLNCSGSNKNLFPPALLRCLLLSQQPRRNKASSTRKRKTDSGTCGRTRSLHLQCAPNTHGGVGTLFACFVSTDFVGYLPPVLV